MHPNAEPGDLVTVGRSNAPTGRPDLGVAQETLGHLVEGDVVRRDEVGVRADHEFRGVNAALIEGRHLMKKHRRIDHDTVADHRDDLGCEDATWQQV